MIKLLCSKCGKKLEAPDEAAGQKGKCPECETIFMVPGEATVKPIEKKTPWWKQQTQLKDLLKSEKKRDNTQTCPDCEKLFSKDALICPNCGHKTKRQKTIENAKTAQGCGCLMMVIGILILIVLFLLLLF